MEASVTKRPYVLWRRVSTKEQGNSGLGLEAQLTMAEYCMKEKPEAVFTDVYSGTKLNECTELWNAIRYCKEKGYLLVIAKTDRFRNVKEALEILDAVGEGNLNFCDLPTTDRMILTIIFAVWERQAMMGRINTKLALAERKKEAEKNGYWISNTNKTRTHLGNDKGCDMSAARAARKVNQINEANMWMESSAAVRYSLAKLAEGWTSTRILKELEILERTNPGQYLTPKGCKVTKTHIHRWKNHFLTRPLRAIVNKNE
jgi:DNA invertase Pin-like site-specific DNA recombinase